jgi:N-acetylmuramoyl-L-alanine amidase
MNKLLPLLLILFALPTAAQQKATGLSNVKLFLDPGHELKNNQGLYKYSEAEKALRVAWAIRDYLLTYTDMQPTNIKLCREDDYTDVSLSQRTDAANAWKADFYYSIHSDAVANPPSSTNSTLYMYGGWRVSGVVYEKTPNGGKAFGDLLHPDLTGVMRINTRGNVADRTYYDAAQTHTNRYAYLHVNYRSNMASLLSEAGFHTSPIQQSRNLNAEWKRLEGYAAYQSLVKFLSAKFGARAVQPVQVGIATGFITESATGTPINGATITITDGPTVKTYTTDTYESLFKNHSNNPNELHNGFYFIEGLTPGATVNVKVEAVGFQTVNRSLTIPANVGSTTKDGLGILDVAMVKSAAPVVSAVDPWDLTSVSIDQPIVLTFSMDMDRSSVESAISLSPAAPVSFAWPDNSTLQIDIAQLAYYTDYTLTINGSVAKNASGGDFLDGDNNGVAGGNYTLMFSTFEPAPAVVTAVEPADLTAVPIDEPIVLTFSRRMDRASVEAAVSLSPSAPLSYTWTDYYTIQIHLSKLTYNTSYTLKIDGSIARNTETGTYLDGDNNGISGGHYLLTFTTFARDFTPPTIVSYDPMNGSDQALSARPIVRIEFSEPLNEAALSPNQIIVTNAKNERVDGIQRYFNINGKSVLHFFFTEDLAANRMYTVTLASGVKDLFGNPLDGELVYSFTARPRETTVTAVLDHFETLGSWWQPAVSGSTTGIDATATQATIARTESASIASTGSLRLDYRWLESAADHRIRLHNTAVTPKFSKENVLQYYLFGDGSGNKFRVALRNGSSGTFWTQTPIDVDWVGWKKITWDLSGDPFEHWLDAGFDPMPEGNVLNLSALGLEPAADPDFLPGAIFIDDLQVVKLGKYRVNAVSDVKAGGEIEVITADQAIQMTASQPISDLRIYSPSGILIKTIKPEQVSYQLPTGGWAAGIYIVRVAAGDAHKSIKLIIK